MRNGFFSHPPELLILTRQENKLKGLNGQELSIAKIFDQIRHLLITNVCHLILVQKVLNFIYSDPAKAIVVKSIKSLLDGEPSEPTEPLPFLLEVSLP